MKHIEEHILELYILRDKNTLRKKASIEKHLRECAGCRELAENIRVLYKDVEQEYSKVDPPLKSTGVLESIEIKDSRLPARLEVSLSELWRRPSNPSPSALRPFKHKTPILLTRYGLIISNFGVRHPIIATAGSVVFLFVLVFLINLSIQTSYKDSNPKYYVYNNKERRIEVYNAQNDLLWFLHSNNIGNPSAQFENDHGNKQSLIVDIDDDGKNEFLTTCSISGVENELTYNFLVYNYKGHLQKSVTINERNIQFRNTHYSSSFRRGYIELLHNSLTGKKEIYTVTSNGRSPSIITRYDHNFVELGKYWHFGNLWIHPVQIMGKNKLIVGGRNDINDILNKDFHFLSVINPDSLIGDQESSATTGFGLPTSSSEEYYIRFLKSDYENILQQSFILSFNPTNTTEHTFSVKIWANSQEYLDLGFEYIFLKKNMSIIEVKYTANDILLHDRLKKEGKLQSSLNSTYLREISKLVSYWNGSAWENNPINIRQTVKK